MRTWDIIDKIEPNTQITVPNKTRQKFVGGVSSLAKVALILTVGFGASRAVVLGRSTVATSDVVVSSKKGGQSISSGAPRGLARDTDTQYGQSSPKLARTFSAFFQPASDEAQHDDDDYSFA